MNFNIKKPSHIFALLLLMVSIFLIFILPIITFVTIVNFPELIESIGEISESTAIQSQLVIIATFILTPFVWYFIVDNLKIKEIFARIKLVSRNIDSALLWGILAMAFMFLIIFIIEFVLLKLGYDLEDLSNIPDIQGLFSLPTLFFIIAIQPIGEEIFFRGFLLEKIDSFAGEKMAILSTAVLFGIAHMSYGKIYPVIMPILIGIILGFVVFKTKNLYSAIIAHVIFNITSLTFAVLGQDLLKQLTLIV
ncbi:MAG: CPBP family intramembrane metalloprotease [Thermoplasmatales archaeon]|nr:MAG: CPBP family intramembrane metalloprotease [Thermoplasmatales archaeon]